MIRLSLRAFVGLVGLLGASGIAWSQGRIEPQPLPMCQGLGTDTAKNGTTAPTDHHGPVNPMDDDRDGVPDKLDCDTDGDGTSNGGEQGGMGNIDNDSDLNPDDPDVDGDGYGNGEDDDTDGDGVRNGWDGDI